MKIGIYGGTFNPIHIGHITIAKTMIQKGLVDEVWMLITPLNPFKKQSLDILPDAERLALASKALEGESAIVASDYEFNLPRPSYTWNTLQRLSADYPEHEFVLLIGADNWQAFDRWSHPEEIIRNYKIVVYPREGITIDETALPDSVSVVDMPLINISSTEIRQRIARRRTIKGLVPESIETDCRKLYKAFFKQKQ